MTFSETKIFTTSIFVSIIIIDISGNLVDTLNNQILLFFYLLSGQDWLTEV